MNKLNMKKQQKRWPIFCVNKLIWIELFFISILVYFFIKVLNQNLNNKPTGDTTSLKYMLNIAIHTAVYGGFEVQKVKTMSQLQQKTKGKTLEGADDLITAGDENSHRIMIYNLNSKLPNIKVVSEESHIMNFKTNSLKLNNNFISLSSIPDDTDEQVLSTDVLIWIDPLDATKEYTENLTQYVSTMVCVAIKGMPVIGIIYFPFQKKLYWAWVGRAVSSAIHTESTKFSQGSTIIVSRSHKGSVENIVKSVFGAEWKIISAGGAGYKMLKVMSGAANAYIHTTLIKKWDICAGSAILHAVQGHVTTLLGNPISYNNASDSEVKDGLLATVRQHNWFLDKIRSYLLTTDLYF